MCRDASLCRALRMVEEEAKIFFFEKKKQKTFASFGFGLIGKQR